MFGIPQQTNGIDLRMQCNFNYAYFHSIVKSGRNATLEYGGFLAGSVVSLLLTPIELVKCRLQVQGAFESANASNWLLNRLNGSAKGPLSLIRSIYTTHGIRGIYSGHMSTFLRESFGCAVWFGVYEESCLRFMRYRNVESKSELYPFDFALCGAASGSMHLISNLQKE